MSLINPAILWGLALVSIPVILHFLLRARPKKYLFPALRLIQARRTHNIRRLRLRHIWLLLLRMGVLALLVMAIARPTLPAANYHPNAGEWLRTLAIAAVGIGTYVWFTRTWKQQRLPHHLMSYRRALLRAAAGVAALLAFLLIVAVPYGRRISAEISSPLPTSAENLPVSAVFLFDSSLSMSYRHQNLTRLEAAQRLPSSIWAACRRAAGWPLPTRRAIRISSFRPNSRGPWNASKNFRRGPSACRWPTEFAPLCNCRRRTSSARSSGRTTSPKTAARTAISARFTSSPI